jgi:serine/threonine protein kinase
MAPEQVLGQDLDGRTDLFGLGLTLYLALTGRSPFTGANTAEITKAVLEKEVAPPSQLRSDVPAELDVAVMGLLRRDLAHRTPSGKELRDRLCLVRGVAAPYPHGKGELAKFIQRAIAQRQTSVPAASPWQLAAPGPDEHATEVTEGVVPTVAGRRPARPF